MNKTALDIAIIETGEDFFNLIDQKTNTIATTYLGGEFEVDPSGNIAWGLINDDVGYIFIGTMEGYGTNFNDELSTLNNALDVVMSDLEASGISKLILDLRFNDGG